MIFPDTAATEKLRRTVFLAGVTLLLTACSMGKMVVRGSQEILDSGVVSMNRETDLQLAKDAMPANLKLLEGMLIEDPNNTTLMLYAAEGFYGYSYGFLDYQDKARARQLYRRCYGHAQHALELAGLDLDPAAANPNDLQDAVARLGKNSVPALFWTASCLGKWIDMNRSDPAGIAALANAAILMQRVVDLDDDFYYGGAHMFFGVYYGGRAPIFGGDSERSVQQFRRAREINRDRLLLVDVLQAEYLDRQQLNRQDFHERLTRVISAPEDLYPEMALVNAIAKKRAHYLLARENEWF
ncbi:MAG: TRAP transporter TatT component family protein [Gammaproteobacteria bacterium]|jgi:hypothetical protein